MAQQINVPGVGMLAFPDGMSEPDMAAAIQKNFPQIHQQPENPAESGTETYFDIPSLSLKQRPSSPLAEGVGQTLAGVGNAARQVYAKTADYFAPRQKSLSDLVTGHDPSRAAEVQQDVNEHAALDKKYLDQTSTGPLGAGLAKAALVSAAPGGLAGSAGGGAALGALTPTTGDESRLANTALGGVGGAAGYGVGNLIGRVGGRLIQPIRNLLTPEAQTAVRVLNQAGVPTDVAQGTGSKVATTLKNIAHDSPFTDTSAFTDAQSRAYTSAALRHVGVNAEEATPAVMGAAKRSLGQTYDAIGSRTVITSDQQLVQELNTLDQAANRNLTPDNYRVVRNQLDAVEQKIRDGAGTIVGPAYKDLQSDLGVVSGSGGSTGHYAGEIRRVLTSALARSASPGDAALLAQTDSRYAAMKQIQKAITPENQVSPSLLYNAMDTTRGANQMVYGQGNQGLAQLAQAGKLILGKATANSGTPQRLAGMAAVGSSGAALYDIASGKQIDSGDLAKGAIAAGFAPAAARALVQSEAGRRYLVQWAQARLAQTAVRNTVGAASRAGGVAGGILGPSASSGQ